MNACLSLEQLPKNWLNSNIWPIPKQAHHNNDLNHTRPITLIEHTRKIFTKILTIRLTTKLAKCEILSPFNTAALPYQSTKSNISTLNHILEDATENDKEIWMVLQDMSKAFDTIHIPTLSKAMERIHLPEKFIMIISFLFNNRTNQVITDHGLSNKYKVQDGIDQGETISPILWRIFYDPLIRRISAEYAGYKIASKQLDVIQNIHVSVMAYMDDSM